MRDPFDFDRLRVDPAKHKPTKPPKWQRHYVRFPWEWVERLRPVKRVSTYRLALLLVYEHWRTGGRPIVLSNAVWDEGGGLSRRSKWSALAELERQGLVAVERHPRKSPRIVLRHLPRE